MSTTEHTETLAQKVKETRARYHALANRNTYGLSEAEKALLDVEYRRAQAEYWGATDALVAAVAPSPT